MSSRSEGKRVKKILTLKLKRKISHNRVGEWEDVGQRVLTPFIRWIHSGDIMFSIVTVVNSTAINLKVTKRVDLKCSHHTHTHKCSYVNG